MDKITPTIFYNSENIVRKYEKGRISRTFIKNPSLLLTYLEAGEVSFQIPLHAFLDWIYNTRLKRYMRDVLFGEILDIGCGTSYVYRSFIQDGWKGTVSGFDASRTMLAEGRVKIDEMLNFNEHSVKQEKALYIYQDSLGRKVLDLFQPLLLTDKNSLLFLKDNRYLSDIRDEITKSYDTVTGLSGPLCFFQLNEQKLLLRKYLYRAKKYASFQFKNQSFFDLNSEQSLLNRISGLIKYIYSNRILDSYAFLESIDFLKNFGLPQENVSNSIKHEVGNFLQYSTPLNKIKKWAHESGFRILRYGSMGFASETFFNLFREFYAKSCGNPTTMREFFTMMSGIDEYFCQKAVWGENLHVTFVRKNTAHIDEIDYKLSQPYRQDYFAY